MTVRYFLLPDNKVEITGEGFETEGEFKIEGEEVDPSDHSILKESLEIGVLCNNAALPEKEDSDAVGDPLEIALLAAGAKAGLHRDELLKKQPEEKEVAFDTDVMMMATFHKKENKYKVAIKGAPEKVIKKMHKDYYKRRKQRIFRRCKKRMDQ